MIPSGHPIHISPLYERKILPASADVPATREKLSWRVSAGVGSLFGLPKRRRYYYQIGHGVGDFRCAMRGTKISLVRSGRGVTPTCQTATRDVHLLPERALVGVGGGGG